MTVQQESQPQEQKPSDKELNFRALEAKYQRQLEQERQARQQAEKEAQELKARRQQTVEEDDDDDDEPYVDKRKLNKKLNRLGNDFKQQTQSEIQKSMEMAKMAAKEELKQEFWLEQNQDFEEVMQHANKFWEKHRSLAETVLRMPEGFERQKLVYGMIKELGVNKAPVKEPSIQETIDAKKKGPYYQPSGVGASPYTSQSDFSKSGQQSAYQKMQELKNKLRLG